MKAKAVVMAAALFLLPLFSGAYAPKTVPDSELWAALWGDCEDFNLPRFQARIKDFAAFVKLGNAWQKSMEQEKVNIRKLNKETCVRWGQSNNGDTALAEFLEQFTKTAKTAIALKKQIVTEVRPKLEFIAKDGQAELRPYSYVFAEFPCGRAITRTTKSIDAQLERLEKLVYTIRDDCPKAADEVIANAVKLGLVPKTTSFAQGSGKTVLKQQQHEHTKSDVSGTSQQAAKDKQGQEIIQRQISDAQKKKSK